MVGAKSIVTGLKLQARTSPSIEGQLRAGCAL